MTYKGMFLGALLVPIAVTSYGKNTDDTKIQQLKERCSQKKLELSELGAKIAEKQALLESLFNEACNAYSEKISDLNLKGPDLEKHTQETNEACKKILTIFESKVKSKENIKGFLLHELIDEEKDSPGDFDPIKFWFLRGYFEHEFLEALIGRYEDCLKELIEIECEIKTLNY
jgi:hypothetical protein